MDTRTKMIETLIDNDITDIRQEIQESTPYFLYNILKHGWKGYDDMSNEELKAEIENREIPAGNI